MEKGNEMKQTPEEKKETKKILLECESDLLQGIEKKIEKYSASILAQVFIQLSLKMLFYNCARPLQELKKNYLKRGKKEYLRLVRKIFEAEIKLGPK